MYTMPIDGGHTTDTPRKFESLDYHYLKGLVDKYISTKSRSKRIYIGAYGWSYSSDGNSLILTPVGDELRLYPYRSWSLDSLLRWLPNGELHVQNYRRLLRFDGGYFFSMHLWRPDNMPPKDGDVYIGGVPQPPAALVPEEHILKLEERAKRLAADLLPPQTTYYWQARCKNGKVKFSLIPHYKPSKDKAREKYSDIFHRNMYSLYTAEKMIFPESRTYCSNLENTPYSYTQALMFTSQDEQAA